MRSGTKKDPAMEAGSWKVHRRPAERVPELRTLPSPLFVAVGFQALAALVVVHLETAFLFKVTHV